MRIKPPQGLLDEPESKLKAVTLLLWEFVHLHGLCMDLCGQGCAKKVITQVEEIYAPEKLES